MIISPKWFELKTLLRNPSRKLMTINQLLKWSNKHLIYLSFLSTGKAYAKMSTKPSALLSLKLFSTAFQNLFYYYALNAPRLSSSANRPVFVHPLSFPNCHFPFKKERNLCAVFMLSHKRLFRHYHKTIILNRH